MSERVAGVVLAGGQGSRLGGLDKGLQLYAGRPLLEFMLDCLAPVCSSVLISANRNLNIYRHYGCPVIPDSGDGFAGPLAGLLAILPVLDCEYALIVPCDMPKLSPTILRHLLRALQSSSVDAVVAADPARKHYSVVACRIEPALIALQDAWAAGDRSLRAWLARLSTQELQFPDVDAFVNCNSPDNFNLDK